MIIPATYQANDHVDGIIAPERIIIKRKRVLLPSGNSRLFFEIDTTRFVPPCTYITECEPGGVEPAYDCGCQPLGTWDIAECVRCLAVTCLYHSDTCRFCGNVFCTGCLAGSLSIRISRLPVRRRSYCICRDCFKDRQTKGLINCVNKQIWGK